MEEHVDQAIVATSAAKVVWLWDFEIEADPTASAQAVIDTSVTVCMRDPDGEACQVADRI